MAEQQSDDNNLQGQTNCSRHDIENDSVSEEKHLTPLFRINLKNSHARNQKFLKDLELSRARLRTYAAYTPTDDELQQRIAEYRRHLQKNMRKSTPS